MGKLRLMVPKPEHKATVMKFREEFLNAGEKVSGGVGLEQAENYEDWLYGKYIPHYGKVSERVFLVFDDHNDLIGISDLRLLK